MERNLIQYEIGRGILSALGVDFDLKPSDVAARINFAQADARGNIIDRIKKTDSMGEDGNFEGKVKVFEEADQCFPYLLNLQPDVVAVTGDHSTPSVLKSHSWHPNPVPLYSKFCRPDRVRSFSESECIHGGLGRFPSLHLMRL